MVLVKPGQGVAVQFENMSMDSFTHLRRLVALYKGDSTTIDREFFSSL